MGTFKRVFGFILTFCIITIGSGLKTNVTCKRDNTLKLFNKVFSISLLVNDTVVAMMDKHGVESRNVSLSVSVYNVAGSLGGESVYMNTELELDCSLSETLECQVFGLSVDLKGYNTVVFTPNVTFEAKVTNTKLHIQPKLKSYSTGETVHIECSVDVGSVDERWSIYAGDDALDYLVNSSLTRSECTYHTTASFQYTFRSTGGIHFNCTYGKTQVGKFLLEAVDMHETLSFHLLLSSMLLVYCPFVVMPFLWRTCSVCSRTYRNPDNMKFKIIRSVVSFLDSVAFIIWWIWVCSEYNHSKEIRGYATFAVIESVFLLGYAMYRCLFAYLEKDDNWFGIKRAYNSRVTTSHGAVMTPIICWLMTRVPNRLPCYPIEVIFWIISSLSILFFAFVSHRREDDDWAKKSR